MQLAEVRSGHDRPDARGPHRARLHLQGSGAVLCSAAAHLRYLHPASSQLFPQRRTQSGPECLSILFCKSKSPQQSKMSPTGWLGHLGAAVHGHAGCRLPAVAAADVDDVASAGRPHPRQEDADAVQPRQDVGLDHLHPAGRVAWDEFVIQLYNCTDLQRNPGSRGSPRCSPESLG